MKAVLSWLLPLSLGLVGSAEAASITFSNTSAISIPDNGPTLPTPSVISTPAGDWNLYVRDDGSGDTGSISGGWEVVIDVVGGLIADVNIRLLGVTHTFFADLDMLVKGPNGINVVLSNDNGGGAHASNITLTFDDEAATSILSLPTSGSILAGSYRPEGGGDPGLVAGTSATSFAAFDGIAFVTASVFEPTTLALFGMGVSALVTRRRAR